MIWLSVLAASVVAEPADAVPEAAMPEEAVPVEGPAEGVAAPPDSSDWRLVSMDCTPDTRAEAALPSGVPPAWVPPGWVPPGWVLADWVLADWVLADWVLADWVLADWVLADWVLAAGAVFDLPCAGHPVEGGGGALACEGSAPASMSVRSEDGALAPGVADLVFWAWPCISCNCCQRA